MKTFQLKKLKSHNPVGQKPDGGITDKKIVLNFERSTPTEVKIIKELS
jgi:hypothetical protein